MKIVLVGVLLVFLTATSAAPRAVSDIVVNTSSDASNGDVGTVASLLTNPGSDGISLREAIEATNNDPGTYTIRFAPALRGRTITVADGLPPLTGGGVTIDGDVGGDGKPDVTLRSSDRSHIALVLASSRNRLHALELSGFDYGVFIMPPVPVPTGRTYAANTVSGLVMRELRFQGVVLDPTAAGNCVEPCRGNNRWVDTTIADNTIEARLAGIMFFVSSSGARVERATVTGNTIRVVGEANGPGIGLTTGGDSNGGPDLRRARRPQLDRGLARHRDHGRSRHRPGTGGRERVRVLDNRLRLTRRGDYFCCQGIVVQAGSDAPGPAKGPPLRYLDDSRVRDVLVRGNVITGTLQWGIQLVAGFGGGGRRNRVEQVRVERNIIRSSSLGTGVYVVAGDGTPFRNRLATDNGIARVTIEANRIAIGRSPVGGTPAIPGGIALQGGGAFGRGNSIRDVRIRGNRIATSHVGVAVIGGIGPTARGNSVSCVRLSGNRVTGTRTEVSVVANQRGARGNHATLRGC